MRASAPPPPSAPPAALDRVIDRNGFYRLIDSLAGGAPLAPADPMSYYASDRLIGGLAGAYNPATRPDLRPELWRHYHDALDRRLGRGATYPRIIDPNEFERAINSINAGTASTDFLNALADQFRSRTTAPASEDPNEVWQSIWQQYHDAISQYLEAQGGLILAPPPPLTPPAPFDDNPDAKKIYDRLVLRLSTHFKDSGVRTLIDEERQLIKALEETEFTGGAKFRDLDPSLQKIEIAKIAMEFLSVSSHPDGYLSPEDYLKKINESVKNKALNDIETGEQNWHKKHIKKEAVEKSKVYAVFRGILLGLGHIIPPFSVITAFMHQRQVGKEVAVHRGGWANTARSWILKIGISFPMLCFIAPLIATAVASVPVIGGVGGLTSLFAINAAPFAMAMFGGTALAGVMGPPGWAILGAIAATLLVVSVALIVSSLIKFFNPPSDVALTTLNPAVEKVLQEEGEFDTELVTKALDVTLSEIKACDQYIGYDSKVTALNKRLDDLRGYAQPSGFSLDTLKAKFLPAFLHKPDPRPQVEGTKKALEEFVKSHDLVMAVFQTPSYLSALQARRGASAVAVPVPPARGGHAAPGLGAAHALSPSSGGAAHVAAPPPRPKRKGTDAVNLELSRNPPPSAGAGGAAAVAGVKK